ncbi:unnamed protein product, partial [Ectocarpus sp. 8 AP-2014]
KVLAFINEVIGEPAYVAGNSLGGYIAANLAANYPRAVLGLALMNATPFWAFRKPNGGSPVEGSGDWLGWDGTLPAPAGLFRFGAWYFDRMRDPRTVKSMLGAVYSN